MASSAGTISGNVTIERYIRARRAWRFLSAPVTTASAPTINAAWQEGVTTASGTTDPHPGYGTHITGANNTGLGFDQNPTGSYSTKESLSANTWTNIANTLTNKVTSQRGYMVFVRGSRANDLSSGVNATADATTLRMTGQLNAGDQSYSLAEGVQVMGNPYASAISIPHTFGVSNTVYSVWDPFLTGDYNVGAFVQYSWNGSAWTASVAPSSALVGGTVESGSAFILQVPTGGATLTLAESDKSAGSSLVQNPTALEDEMRVVLSKSTVSGTYAVLDGMVTTYATGSSNLVDDNDAIKANNFAQQISTKRNGVQLAIERRNRIAGTDTSYLQVANLSAGAYHLAMQANNLTQSNLFGKLVDQYTGTSSMLDLNGNYEYAFTVDANAGSYAADRFKIVYYQAAPLPVSFTTIKAWQQGQGNTVKVEWSVDNQINISRYQVERSGDGRSFTAIGSQAAMGINGAAMTYALLDAAAINGDNFYRIKSIGLAGDVQYSKVVKLRLGKLVEAISIYPNPVMGRQLTIAFSGMAKGKYELSIINPLGQTLQAQSIELQAANATQTIAVDAKIAKGNYQLQLIKPSGEKTMLKLVIAE